mmetsp:Transcript_9345/g.38216  ORF Transcript_9345/g.38216 Transcript_9345/m.38216 type:complete len:374 (-) Transcript_9345:1528-2649(-)
MGHVRHARVLADGQDIGALDGAQRTGHAAQADGDAHRRGRPRGVPAALQGAARRPVFLLPGLRRPQHHAAGGTDVQRRAIQPRHGRYPPVHVRADGGGLGRLRIRERGSRRHGIAGRPGSRRRRRPRDARHRRADHSARRGHAPRNESHPARRRHRRSSEPAPFAGANAPRRRRRDHTRRREAGVRARLGGRRDRPRVHRDPRGARGRVRDAPEEARGTFRRLPPRASRRPNRRRRRRRRAGRAFEEIQVLPEEEGSRTEEERPRVRRAPEADEHGEGRDGCRSWTCEEQSDKNDKFRDEGREGRESSRRRHALGFPQGSPRLRSRRALRRARGRGRALGRRSRRGHRARLPQATRRRRIRHGQEEGPWRRPR